MKWISIILTLLIVSLKTTGQSWTWGKQLLGLGTQRFVNGYIVKTDKCNNSFVAGIWKSDSLKIGTSTYRNPDVSINNYQCYIVKYDSTGSIQWSDASILGQALPYGLAVDVDGNSYLYGCFWTDSVKFGTHLLVNDFFDSCLTPWCGWGTGCYFIVKYDPTGNIIWSQKGDNVLGMGGDIILDNASNIYVSGAYWNTTMKIGSDTLYNSSYKKGDIFLAKYDSSGNFLWAKSYGDTSDEFTSGIAYSNNRIYMTGNFKSPVLGFGSSTLLYRSFVPAYNIGNAFLVQLDTSGNPIWSKSSVGSAIPYGIAVDNSESIYIGGQIFDTNYVSFNFDTLRNTHLRYGGFLTKYDTLGNVKWTNGIFNTTTTITSSGFGQGNKLWSLATDKCKNIWISGAISGDPGGIIIDSGVLLHAPSGSWDPLYLIGYNPNGNLLQSQALKSGSDNGGKIGLTSDNSGSILISSTFNGTTFIFGYDTLLTYGGWPMFLAKYNPSLGCSSNICSQDVVDISTNKNTTSYTLYPNPTKSIINIKSNEVIYSATIVNMLGQIVYSKLYNTFFATLDLSHLPNGVYFAKINGSIYERFIKE
jgi:hypothetical protein